MRTLLLAASGLSLLLFTACAGPAPIDQQIRKLAEQVGAEHLGAVSVGPRTVWMTYTTGGVPKSADNVGGQVSIWEPLDSERAMVSKPVGIDELQLDRFADRLHAQDACPAIFGTIAATHGGAILQTIGCDHGGSDVQLVVKDTYLDGRKLEPLRGLTEEGILAAIADLGSMTGDRVQGFTVRMSEQDRGPIQVQFTAASESKNGIDGEACRVLALRHQDPDPRGELAAYLGCSPLGLPAEPTFAMSEIPIARLLTAVEDAAGELDADIETLEGFHVFVDTGLAVRVSSRGAGSTTVRLD